MHKVTGSNFQQFVPIPFLAHCLALVAFSLVPAISTAAVVLQDATFLARAGATVESEQTTAPGSVSASNNDSGDGWARHALVTSGTLGVPRPEAQTSGDFSLTIDKPTVVGVTANGQASVAYFVAVVPLSGAPVVSNVPVLFFAKGDATVVATGGANAIATAAVGGLVSRTVQACIGPTCAQQSNHAQFSISALPMSLQPDVPASLSVQVFGGGSVNSENGFGVFEARVDPLFTIDPSFEFRDQFGLVFSKGIGNVPEPDPLAFTVLGMLAVVAYYRSRSRRIGT